jgi:hypothetical protein
MSGWRGLRKIVGYVRIMFAELAMKNPKMEV